MTQIDLFEQVIEIPKTTVKPMKQNNQKIIDKLLKQSESLFEEAEKVNTDVNGNWTYRRQRIADNAYSKKQGLIKDATALKRLAELWEVDACPEILKSIRTKGDLTAHYPQPLEDNEVSWYKEEYPTILKKAERVGLKSQADNEPFRDAIKQLSEIVLTPEQQKAIQLKQELAKVHSYNIHGFFPTPDDVIEKMIELAEMEYAVVMLEPSCGIGSIADRVKDKYPNIGLVLVEQQHSLAKICELKGYNVFNDDILTVDLGVVCDRILMNPPFEKGQDIDHVLHCYKTFLKEGGKLVSIMSAGVLSNSTKKYVEFREFVAQHGGEFIQLGQAFKNAFNSTGVSTVILIIDK